MFAGQRLFRLFDGREDVWFACLVTICSHTKIDLFGIFVGFKGLSNAYDDDQQCRKHVPPFAPRIGSGGPAGTVAHVDASAPGLRMGLLAIILDTRRARSMFSTFGR